MLYKVIIPPDTLAKFVAGHLRLRNTAFLFRLNQSHKLVLDLTQICVGTKSILHRTMGILFTLLAEVATHEYLQM
jgi:hypothetical protein